MLHALHFRKKSDGEWSIYYNNRYVESETFKLETQLNKPSFLPAIEGDSLAVLAAYICSKHGTNKNIAHTENYYINFFFFLIFCVCWVAVEVWQN